MKHLSCAILSCFSALSVPAAVDPYYPSPATVDSSRLVLPGDMNYLGAFRLPKSLSGSQNGFIYLAGAMTYRPAGDAGGALDGYPGSLYIAGHVYEHLVAEVSIPAPFRSKNYDSLPVAPIITPFRGVGTAPSGSGLNIMAIEYMPPQGTQTTDKLHVTMGDSYLPTTQKTYWTLDPNFGNQTAPRTFVGDNVNCYNDYLFTVPQSWADRYAPGMHLGGGRHREGNLCGQGPALFVMKPWTDASSANVSTLPILRYKDLDGSLVNYSHGGDVYNAAAWLESGSKSAVILTGRKGLGRPAYGNYCGVQGFHDLNGYRPYMLFYDPEELGKVALGQLASHIPQPYAAINLNDLLVFKITASCQRYHLSALTFDPSSRILYATESSRGDYPVVHAWKIGAGGGSTPPVPPNPVPPSPCEG